MNFLTINIKLIFKVVLITLLFQTTLWGMTNHSENIESEANQNNTNANYTEVSLDSFGNMGIGIVLILTSVLGAFFLRNELDGAI